MLKAALLTSFLFFFIINTLAQQSSINGRVTDSSEKKNLHHAVISLLKKSDTTLVVFTRSDVNGKFSLPKVDTGNYVLLVTYPRFTDFMEQVVVKDNTELGDIFMTLKSKMLEEVVIRSAAAIRIKGDTTEFVADSFKVKEGATVEDLLKRLPGFSVNSKGEIVAQGKRVDKVLVDGEEFFGDDPTMATQNISAKAVDRVQVFETKTEQQNMTGMSTGNEGKTVNIKLKDDAKKGSFGKIHAGTDFTKYIDSKALYNRFIGKKKFSVYGTRTNINAGSLNWEDRQKLGIENDFEYDELSGYYFSFGGGDDFNDWNLRGLPDAYTAGALFSNKWNADKHNVNLSYRFNSLGTTNNGTSLTQNISSDGITYSNRYTTKDALNQQHAVNGKYEWKLDSLASFKLVTAYTKKNSHVFGTTNGEFIKTNLDTANTSFNTYDNYTKRDQIDNQFTYKQMFKKKNRQWQTVLRYGVTDDDNDGLNKTDIRYFDINGVYDRSELVDQQKTFEGRSTTIGIKTSFIEPLSATWMLVMDYAFNKNSSTSLRNTYEKDLSGDYKTRITEFSNNFELDAFSHSGNAIVRYTGKKMRLGIGSGISTVKLGLQNLDVNEFSTFKFLNVTPQAQINFMPKSQMNIGINYRGTTRQPTLSQLQPLRDNTDPLIEYQGNPDLKVGFNHGISVFYNRYKVLAQSWLGLHFSYNIMENAITQFNTFDQNTGKRTYYPVNVNGNKTWNFWSDYSKEGGEKKLYYGFSLNGSGGSFNNFVNSEKINTSYYNANFDFRVGTRVADKYDLSITPRIGYNSSKTSAKTTTDNNYFSYGGRVEANVTLPWKMEAYTNLNAELRQLTDAFPVNNNLVVWNAGLSRKIFKKNTGKISLIANDILDENKGINRSINSTIISDERFQRISRYFLLRFEWSFNKMPGGETK